MKRIIFIFFILFSTISFSQTSSTYFFNTNNIEFGINNSGNIGGVQFDHNNNWYGGGAFFDDVSIFYTAGFALTGYDNGQLWGSGMIPSSSLTDYLPGKVGSDPNNEKNKIYVIKSGDQDFGESWQEWKDAVELGAYFYDGNNDSLYNPVDLNGNGIWDENEDMPDLIGDLTVWSVFNDTDVDTFASLSTEPKGIEIKQTIFLSASPNAGDLGNVIFIRYIIENMGTVAEQFDSVYFSFFIDPDIGKDYTKDYAGCDTTLQIGYAYKKDADDSTGYGTNPPSIILNPLQSPYKFISGETYIDNNGNNIFDKNIDTPLDTAIIKRGPRLGEELIIGAKNIDWRSFTPYQRGPEYFSDPNNPETMRNYMLGGRYKDGSKIEVATFPLGNGNLLGAEANLISPKYIFSGNPIDGTGWLPNRDYDSDIRMLLSYGPFTLSKNKPVEVMAAYVVGRGDSHLTSITEAFRINEQVQNLYDNNFKDIPVGIVKSELPSTPTEYSLSLNYPNPFNPTTTITYQIQKNGFVNLVVYNTLGQVVSRLVNEHQRSGKYSVQFDATSLSSGVYFYKLQVGDFTETKKMLLLR